MINLKDKMSKKLILVMILAAISYATVSIN
jgi:hypothetical protein